MKDSKERFRLFWGLFVFLCCCCCCCCVWGCCCFWGGVIFFFFSFVFVLFLFVFSTTTKSSYLQHFNKLQYSRRNTHRNARRHTHSPLLPECMVCLGLWQGLSTEESPEPGPEPRVGTPGWRSSRKKNTCSYDIPSCRTQYRQMSFFPRTIPDWNGLSQEVVTAESLDCFKSRLNSLL